MTDEFTQVRLIPLKGSCGERERERREWWLIWDFGGWVGFGWLETREYHGFD